MRSLLVATALVVASAWGIVHQLPEGEAQAEPGAVGITRPQQIESIAFDGENLPLASLRDALTTHAGEQVDAGKLSRDRAALATALHARGFLAAKVGAAQVSFDEAGGAFITFAIAQGPMYRVRSVAVTGASAKDTGVVTLAADEVASPVRFEEAREALTTRLAARGKPASVTVQLAVDDAVAAVDVALVVAH